MYKNTFSKFCLKLFVRMLGLEESMKYYEKGTELADFCAKKLKEAELKIKNLSEVGEEE